MPYEAGVELLGFGSSPPPIPCHGGCMVELGVSMANPPREVMSAFVPAQSGVGLEVTHVPQHKPCRPSVTLSRQNETPRACTSKRRTRSTAAGRRGKESQGTLLEIRRGGQGRRGKLTAKCSFQNSFFGSVQAFGSAQNQEAQLSLITCLGHTSSFPPSLSVVASAPATQPPSPSMPSSTCKHCLITRAKSIAEEPWQLHKNTRNVFC